MRFGGGESAGEDFVEGFRRKNVRIFVAAEKIGRGRGEWRKMNKLLQTTQNSWALSDANLMSGLSVLVVRLEIVGQ